MNYRWTPHVILTFCAFACVGKRVEPAAPVETVTAPPQDDAVVVESRDGVIISRSIARGPASIVATVMDEVDQSGDSSVQIGLIIRYGSKEVRESPAQYSLSLTVAQTGAQAGILLSQSSGTDEAFDRVLRIKGASLDQIHDAYPSIRLYLTVVDRSARASSSISPSIDQIISQ